MADTELGNGKVWSLLVKNRPVKIGQKIKSDFGIATLLGIKQVQSERLIIEIQLERKPPVTMLASVQVQDIVLPWRLWLWLLVILLFRFCGVYRDDYAI